MTQIPPLNAVDPPLFDFYQGGRGNILLICEHGGNAMPQSFRLLGLDPGDMNTHAAIDLGARTLTETLAATMDVSAICANYSRLIIDLNRFPDAPDLIPANCENKPVPGNSNLTAHARDLRRQEFYDPFHDHIRDWLDRRAAAGTPSAVVTLHSYTPTLGKTARAEEICIVSNTDRRLADPALNDFRQAGYKVGDNKPFDGRRRVSATFNRHGDDRGIPCLMIEYRNDLLQDKTMAPVLAAQTAAILNSNLLRLGF
ncbi:MAG: N-formylglutamate amidohydrolase [Micavibrio sp.]|nr:N-formylglutamate amidohydrolase [Micavibrio sp.]